jgi:1,2-diacylglycerol 3-alpha-glucosyltransferase
MNICMFTNTYVPFVGGIARSVQFFAEDLSAQGHRLLVVAPRYEKHSNEDDRELRVPAIRKFNGSEFSVRLPVPFMVERRIQEFDPHVIHSHHPFFMGDTALRVARKRDLPLLFTHHTMYERYIHYLPMASEALRHFVMRWATVYANLCDGVIAPSRSIAEILRRRGVTPRIVEIPSGVDMQAIGRGQGLRFRRETGIPPKAKVVGHLGRLAPEKNPGFLAHAVTRFMERHAQAYFLIVGHGPSEEEIASICRAAGVRDRLILAGELSGSRVYDAYHAMDLFVFASHTETQGMVLAEAMAAGKPVIALDAPGAREVIADGFNGRLLQASASEDEFAEAVAQFFADGGIVPSWSAAAKHTAMGFARHVCAKKMSDFYSEVLAEQQHIHRNQSKSDALDAFRLRLRTEWELLSQKTQVMANALHSNRNDQRAGTTM